MSPLKQNVTIAEACGWTNVRETAFGLLGCHPKADLSVLSDEYLCARPIPDYLNDLNACHEFEKSLPSSLTQKYWWSLCDVTGLDQYEACRDPLLTVSATAAQRCEAFLKTINKWVSTSLKQ